MYEYKENRGSSLRLTDKNNESSPDFTGTINVEGKIFRIACWEGKTKNGQDRHSYSVSIEKS